MHLLDRAHVSYLFHCFETAYFFIFWILLFLFYYFLDFTIILFLLNVQTFYILINPSKKKFKDKRFCKIIKKKKYQFQIRVVIHSEQFPNWEGCFCFFSGCLKVSLQDLYGALVFVYMFDCVIVIYTDLIDSPIYSDIHNFLF